MSSAKFCLCIIAAAKTTSSTSGSSDYCTPDSLVWPPRCRGEIFATIAQGCFNSSCQSAKEVLCHALDGGEMR